MTRSPQLTALLRRGRRARLARLLAGAIGIALGLGIVAGVRVTIAPRPAQAARAVATAH